MVALERSSFCGEVRVGRGRDGVETRLGMSRERPEGREGRSGFPRDEDEPHEGRPPSAQAPVRLVGVVAVVALRYRPSSLDVHLDKDR